MSGLYAFEHGGILVVDSRLIAPQLGIEHINFLETLEDNKAPIEEAFGVIRFETEKPKMGSKGGRPQKFALLTEDQAYVAMTFSRNTPEVLQAKIELVQAFSKARDLLKQRQSRPDFIPYWYQRMKIALSDVQNPLQIGYFCVYQETMSLFCEMETRLGYLVADIDPATGRYLVPDISIGKGFNEFMRSQDSIACSARENFLGSIKVIDFRQPCPVKGGWFKGGEHYREIMLYTHVYPKISHGKFQRQPSYSYPGKYLLIFRHYLQEYWIPNRCVPYLVERDPKGMAAVKARLMKMSEAEQFALKKTLVGKIIPLLSALPESA